MVGTKAREHNGGGKQIRRGNMKAEEGRRAEVRGGRKRAARREALSGMEAEWRTARSVCGRAVNGHGGGGGGGG